MPTKTEIPVLCPEKTVQVAKFGDLFLINGRWPVISHIQDWDRNDWPMPKFVRRDAISKRAFLITYSEDVPKQPVLEERCDFDASFETDSVWGAGFAEAVLAKVLCVPLGAPPTSF